MAKQALLLLVGFGLMALASKVNAINHIQCWHCSSNAIGSENFCGETFKEKNIPSDLKERNISVLRTCNSTINSEYERAVCRKTVDEAVNGEIITKRFCYYTNKADPLDQCNWEGSKDPAVKRTYCQDCTTDKCNSALKSAATFGAFFMPILLAKVLVL